MPDDKPVNFFDKSFEEQVKIAIDCSDPELLQVLLGLENCQLWEYWLTHSLLLHNIFGIIKTLKYQLPLNIINGQSKILAKNFPAAYRALPTIKEFYLSNELIATLEQLERELENTTKTYKILAKIFPTIYCALPTKDEDQLSKELVDILKQLETKPENTITCLSKIIEINEIQQHRELVNILEYFKIAFEVARRNITRHKANNDKVNEANQELESAEQEILKKYKSFNCESIDNKYQIFSVQNIYVPDPEGEYVFSYYSE
ncbi:hypothetical protein [Candidatus Mesenet endosymbiont of Agriotes lineatus]|uniref:hypothetical protein n=1 Tax=Candidatus Mesenet endosymbiont of Agriotes lineatus TaxID=3077948 RepID=UPI0030CB6FF5